SGKGKMRASGGRGVGAAGAAGFCALAVAAAPAQPLPPFGAWLFQTGAWASPDAHTQPPQAALAWLSFLGTQIAKSLSIDDLSVDVDGEEDSMKVVVVGHGMVGHKFLER